MTDQTLTTGEAVSLVLPAASGGNGRLTYSLEPAMRGLRFDGASRTLSGAPTTAATYSMTYGVTDADANTDDSDGAMQAFTITVEPHTAPRFAETLEDQSFTAGEDESVTLPEASGGNGAPSYVLEPEGPRLTFDTESRALSDSFGARQRFGSFRRTPQGPGNVLPRATGMASIYPANRG